MLPAATPLKRTESVPDPVKCQPLIITESLDVPLVGVKYAMYGPAGTTVNGWEFVNLPNEFVTTSAPLIAPEGTMTLMFEPPASGTGAPGTPPNNTPHGVVK